MKKTLLLFSVSLLFSHCSEPSLSNASAKKLDSTSIATKDSMSEEEYPLDPEYELNYVVSVCEGYDYDSLHGIAIEAANILNI